MKKIYPVLFILLFFGGCNSKSGKGNNGHDIVLGKIELSNAWARPGAKGQNSAAYLTITNGTATNDTLTGASSNISQKAQVHETFKTDSGETGMRPAGNLIINAGDKLQITPDNYHIMLMGLNKELAVGDSLDLTLEFRHAGHQTVRIPVKIQN
ncbi:MAG TPA: copper chaperone PCu(A)C [Balneolaceae bacterium]|nr:copper chaperone PCu(A)C [Balneolaceae bacterium]